MSYYTDLTENGFLSKEILSLLGETERNISQPSVDAEEMEKLNVRVGGFLRIFDNYIKHFGLGDHRIIFNRERLCEIIKMVDKKKEDFKVLRCLNMSELVEASLYGFWILKLSPFSDVSNPDIRVNVNFAIYLMLMVFHRHCIKSGKKKFLTRERITSLVKRITIIDKEDVVESDPRMEDWFTDFLAKEYDSLFTVTKVPIVGIKKTDIQSTRGEIVEIGQVNMSEMLVRDDVYDIPTFDYIIIKRKQCGDSDIDWDGGKYVSTCINLKTDGYGTTPSEAWDNMNTNVRDYVLMLLEHYDYSHTVLERVFMQDNIVQRFSVKSVKEA